MTSRLGRSAILAAAILGASVNAVWCRDAGAAPDRVSGQLIVKPRAGIAKSSRAAIAARLGGRVLRELPLIGAQVVEVAPDRTEAALAAAKRDPDVDYAEPNWIVHTDVLPNDPQFAEQWSLRNTGQTGGTPGADIRATLAWGVFRGDSNLRIGIIDTGMQLDHPDLAANLWTNPGEIPGNGLDDDSNGYVDDVHGYDVVNGDGDPSDDYFHGTHVAGTIGATGDDGIGVAGIAWACDLVPIKFLDSTGNGTIDGAVLALAYAVRVGVALTNNSWSGGPFSQALHDGIVAAGEANQLFIAAAGNSATNNDAIPVYPASYDIPCIVTVAATDDDDLLAAFSNYGATSVDLAAPGVERLFALVGDFHGGTARERSRSPPFRPESGDLRRRRQAASPDDRHSDSCAHGSMRDGGSIGHAGRARGSGSSATGIDR
jgi:subtilisin family serine protease